MKQFFIALVFLGTFTSCSTLHSTTSIQPNDSFILGNNKHGFFKVKLKNVSKNNLEVYHASINGGKHSSQNVKPNHSVMVKVDKNTALIIANQFDDTATVTLRVTGDVGLSMGYKNKNPINNSPTN
jgi:hypothetical protein